MIPWTQTIRPESPEAQPWPPYIPPGLHRLQLLIVARQCTRFAWGSHDCALWAADAVLARTGRDIAADVRGTYSTGLQAMRVMRQHGGLFGLASARLGSRVALARAADGDIALLRAGVCTSGDGALAVWWQGRPVAAGAAGLVVVEPAAVRTMWRAA